MLTAPLSSKATALNSCVPLVAVQLALYGALVACPTNTPSTENSTRATEPSASEAFAASVMTSPAFTCAVASGAVNVTLGAWLVPPDVLHESNSFHWA
ncbi:Uncharacterised protein [Vibrio cholerae]|uniref:Secreted protein n=1 Tax=Vibrio cholerae TaxID=666 RepID=A0A655Y6H6_VIBCL|nr:Uncharacterised protein [Vibrio cholerae]